MSTGTIRISSLSAYFNKDTELIGKQVHTARPFSPSSSPVTAVLHTQLLGAVQDPYVVFEIGNKKVTTKHIKGAGAGEAAWDDVRCCCSHLLHSRSQGLPVLFPARMTPIPVAIDVSLPYLALCCRPMPSRTSQCPPTWN